MKIQVNMILLKYFVLNQIQAGTGKNYEDWASGNDT